jgi:hypothetical protein
MKEDLQHLKLLSIFHYVVGALIGLVSCIPIIHLVVGLVMIIAPPSNNGPGPGPEVVGLFFVLIAGGAILLGWTCAAMALLAGWFLPQCKHYAFCLVVAGMLCLFAPKGTILGVFTFIVLLRPSVKRMFETGIVDEGEELPKVDDGRVWRTSYDVRYRAYRDD